MLRAVYDNEKKSSTVKIENLQLKFKQHSLASSKKYNASSKIYDDILECFNKNKCAILFILHT